MRILLAVSGGIDSMCMADMFSRDGRDFGVAHCNFHLRGDDSNADAAFVRKWAEEHGVKFFHADFDTSTYAAEHGISIEMAARELRYAWFAQVAEAEGFDAIATAHNANDNAETLILNLLRGTGSRGLRGISSQSSFSSGPSLVKMSDCRPTPPMNGPLPLTMPRVARFSGAGSTALTDKNRITIIRPLLGMTRREIEEYAREHGVEYREDRTNAEIVYKRNRIRNVVFPEFEKINPSFVKTLNADMERFAMVDDIAEDYFREAEGKVFDGRSIAVPELLAHKHWRYVLFRLLEPFGLGGRTFDDIVALLSDVAESKDITFSGKRFCSPGYVLESTAGRLVVHERFSDRPEGDDASVIVHGPGLYGILGRTVRVEEIGLDPEAPLKQPAGVLVCDAGVLRFPFILRGWMAADWMRPFGMGGKSKKISDLFTDLKFSLSDKESAVMLVSPALNSDGDGHVAALAGHRMDEALRIPEGSTKAIRISLL